MPAVRHAPFLCTVLTPRPPLLRSGIWAGLVGFFLVLYLFKTLYFVVLTTKASTNLHNWVFERVLRADMPFFEANPTGRILNR